MQPDGKIVIASSSGDNELNPVFDLVVARYTAGGSLDTDFGASGKRTTPIGRGTLVPNGLTGFRIPTSIDDIMIAIRNPLLPNLHAVVILGFVSLPFLPGNVMAQATWQTNAKRFTSRLLEVEARSKTLSEKDLSVLSTRLEFRKGDGPALGIFDPSPEPGTLQAELDSQFVGKVAWKGVVDSVDAGENEVTVNVAIPLPSKLPEKVEIANTIPISVPASGASRYTKGKEVSFTGRFVASKSGDSIHAVMAIYTTGASDKPGVVRFVINLSDAGFPPDLSELTAWTSADGRSIQAKLLRREGNNVVLKRGDGGIFTIPISSLAPDSQKAAKEIASPQDAAMEAIGQQEFRVFASANGSRLEAALLAHREGLVTIQRKNDGMVFTTPATSFSAADQEYVETRAAEGKLAVKEREFEIVAGEKMRFVWCPPGTFVMGCPEGEGGHFGGDTRHEVTLTRGFWIGKYEVTQAQWQRVTGLTPSKFLQSGPDSPVDSVSWTDCNNFTAKLEPSFRLPTEAEWEYACRAGTSGQFNVYGVSLRIEPAKTTERGGTTIIELPPDPALTPPVNALGWFQQREGGSTHPVGKKRPNTWGIHDMHGNVEEWCLDSSQDDLGNRATTDPKGAAIGERRVTRGGNFRNPVGSCRSGGRFFSRADQAADGTGLRLVREGNSDGGSPLSDSEK